MSTVNLTPTAEQQAKSIFAERKKRAGNVKFQETKGTGLTFAELSQEQLLEAMAYAKRVWAPNATDRQKQMDSLNDAITEALLAIYKGQYRVKSDNAEGFKVRGVAPWDSERGSFHTYFSNVVGTKLMNVKKIERMSDSYSHADSSSDNAAPVFNFSSPSQDPEAQANVSTTLDVIKAKLTPRDNEILAMMLEDWNDEEMSELLGLNPASSFQAVRTAKSRLRDKIKSLGFSY